MTTRARVLVIEDDPAIGSMLRRALELKELEVRIAEDTPEARDAWQEGGYAAVLLDVMLPDGDGIALCAERRDAGDRTPVIVLTARDDEGTRIRGEAAAVDAFLAKPFAYRELIEVLERFLPARAGVDRVAQPRLGR